MPGAALGMVEEYGGQGAVRAPTFPRGRHLHDSRPDERMAKHDPLRCRIDPCKVLPLSGVEIPQAESSRARSVNDR